MLRSTFSDELRTILSLAVPVVLGQLGMMALHVVDTFMLGQFGVTELAAASLGSQWIFFTLTIGLGVITGIDPLVAQSHGAGDGPATGRALQQGGALALLSSLGIMALWLITEPIMLLLGQEPELARQAHEYTVLQIPSVFPFLAWVALRSYLQGQGIVKPGMWVMLPVNLLNIALNYALVFGNWGCPELGLTGAAIATCISRLATGGLLLAWVLYAKLYVGAWTPLRRHTFRWVAMRRAVSLGLPIGLQMGLEVGAFALTAIIAGQLGEKSLAAHSIVLSIAALIFMAPLGVSIATTTRIGNLVGMGEASRLGRPLRAITLLSAGLILINVSSLLLFGPELAALYTDDLEVRRIAAGAFLVCAAFQLSDSVQVVSGGALRGMGQTRPPAVATLFGYYAFGLPVGYWLGVSNGQGLSGLWWGLAVGLTVVGLGLLAWLMRSVHALKHGSGV